MAEKYDVEKRKGISASFPDEQDVAMVTQGNIMYTLHHFMHCTSSHYQLLTF
jgi:hypothetical protein